MQADLQGLLERINREGIEKAEAAAAEIRAKAEAEAEALVAKAKDDAAAATAAAEKQQALYAERAQETIRQAARDTVLKVGEAVTRYLEGLLGKAVNAALADENALAGLAGDAIRAAACGGDAEVAVADARLAEGLRAKLAAEASAAGVRVVTDAALGTGFSLRLEGGRVEHDFTGATVTAELARHLRPDLAALV